MHAFSALKHAALGALETEDGPGDMVGFFSIIDPQSVLELVELAETRISDDKVQALHIIIAEMGGYIRRRAPGPQAEELLLRARRLVGLTIR